MNFTFERSNEKKKEHPGYPYIGEAQGAAWICQVLFIGEDRGIIIGDGNIKFLKGGIVEDFYEDLFTPIHGTITF